MFQTNNQSINSDEPLQAMITKMCFLDLLSATSYTLPLALPGA